MNAPTQAPSKELFEAWLNAPATGPAVSPDNPYPDWQTRHLYEAWCAAWSARSAPEPPAPASNDVSSERLADLLASCIMQSETGGHADDYNAFLCDLACVCMELQRRRTSLEPSAKYEVGEHVYFMGIPAKIKAVRTQPVIYVLEGGTHTTDLQLAKRAAQPPEPDAPEPHWSEALQDDIYYASEIDPYINSLRTAPPPAPEQWQPLPAGPTPTKESAQ